MSNEEKRYAGIEALQKFLENCKAIFAGITHTHSKEDIEDLVVDAEMSETSENPVQNKTISTEINLIKEVISEKADSEHDHDNKYYTEAEIDNMEFITVEDIDAICGGAIQYAEEVMF